MNLTKSLKFYSIILLAFSVFSIAPFSLPKVPAATLPSHSVLDNYLMVGMRESDIGVAVNVQNTELGADRKFLSDGSTAPSTAGEAGPNLRDVFYQDGDRWTSDSAPPSPAAAVFEGIDWSGDTAITSSTGEFSLSNVDLFGQVGVQCGGPLPCDASVSNSYWFPDPSVGPGQSMPQNGVSQFDSSPLLSELSNWKTFIQGLSAETTITQNIENENAKDGSGPEVFDLTAADTNSDGIAVIDILINGGNSDFELNNSDWILQGTDNTLGIFRIRGESNFNINNSSILLGDGGIAGGSSSDPIEGIGAIFFKGDEEGSDSSDKVFNGNNVVLNGVALWDLVTVGEGGDTELGINNGQGCAQFVSSSIDFNNVRWNHCGGLIPEPTSLALLAWAVLLPVVRRQRQRRETDVDCET